MKEVSAEFFQFLDGQAVFTDVVGTNNGLRKLFPIAAPGDTPTPFSTYRIREQSGETKDGSAFLVQLATYFGADQYDACCEFSDALTPVIKSEYEWFSSEPDMDDETEYHISFINFKITK